MGKVNKSGTPYIHARGRYPFRSMLPEYLESRAAYLSPSTIDVHARQLRQFAKVFEELRAQGRISTTNPAKMERRDIEAVLRWMIGKNLAECTRKKYLQILDSYLAWAGNDVIEDMKNDRRLRLPKEYRDAPIRALSVEELGRILQAAESIKGWPGTVIRGYIALGFGTGCRPKELLNAEPPDVDLSRMLFYVRHPKGENTWGRPEWIPIIRGDMLPWIEELMEARKRREDCGTVSQYLFVNPSTNKAYSANQMRRYKALTEKATGIRWTLKDLRSSLTSVTVSQDVSKLKAASLQLRHSSVSTTEKYYARINRADAIAQSIGDDWKKNPVVRRPE